MKLFSDLYSSVTWVVMSSNHWQTGQKKRSKLEIDLGVVRIFMILPLEK